MISFGLEQQTKRKRATGDGRIAAPGTSPTGEEANSRTMLRIKMVTVRTVRFYTPTSQGSAMAWMDGMMFLATGENFTMFARSQSAQVISLKIVHFWFTSFSEGIFSSTVILAITCGCAFGILLFAAQLKPAQGILLLPRDFLPRETYGMTREKLC